MDKNRTRVFLLLILVVLTFIFLLETNLLPRLPSKPSPQKELDLVTKVISLIRHNYIEEPEPVKTMNGAFKGLVDSLDPLSCYLDKEGVLRYSKHQELKLKDIGVVLFKSYGFFPQVVGLIENSPAQEGGVKIGDTISALNGRSTLMASMVEANLYLKSEKATSIKVKILRGSKTLEMNIETALLFEEPFSYTPAKGTSGILKINKLFQPCVERIKEQIVPRIKEKGRKTLILDLRNCYEGEIEEARKLINLFLKEPKIGTFEKKGTVVETLSSMDEAPLASLPLIVWTNAATMGSGEAVAGVLKEFKKAKIIGIETPGLVAKQDFFPMEDGSGILLTSSLFHLNSGKSLWETGVMPDVKIEGEDQGTDSYLKKSLSS
jgi:carboxyl-terminal processing protease